MAEVNNNSFAPRLPDRLREKVRLSGAGIDAPRWYGVLSSRLGQPVERRTRWFQLLRRVVETARRDGAALVVVPGTAAAAWIERAAELYRQPLVRVEPASDENAENTLDPDRLIAQVSDRLFVLRARNGGKISRIISELLTSETPAEPIRVAIWPDHDDAGAELLTRGAIGWYLYGRSGGADFPRPSPQTASPQTASGPRCVGTDLNRLEQQGPWLLHCTRARGGPLPGQPESQWRDEVLLGGDGGLRFSVIEVLVRIVSERFLKANSISGDSGPVVCMTELPLSTVIQRRTFRPHRHRWDFEPYGIGLRQAKVIEIGGCPVVYGDRQVKMKLDKTARWKYQAVGKTYDWESEREWRVPGGIDLSHFTSDDLFIFLPDDPNQPESIDPLLIRSPWPIYPVPVQKIPIQRR